MTHPTHPTRPHPFVAAYTGAVDLDASSEASSGGKRKPRAQPSVASERLVGGVAFGLFVCAFLVGRSWK